MVRLARFTDDAFVDAAIALVAEGGPSAATIAAIARKVGAPTGSVYHRFASRAEILARAWITVRLDFAAAIAPMMAAGRGRDAALAMVGWARQKAVRARFLLLNELDDLLDGPPPPNLLTEIEACQLVLDDAFRACARMVLPRSGEADEATARLRFLALDGPLALVRPHLLAGQPVPAYVDSLVAELHGVPDARRRPGHTERVA